MRPNGYIMKYNPEIHHRRSIRLKGYDYTQPGAYFVTIVTHKRDEIFGEITNGRMKYSTLGEIVYQEWFRSAKIRKEIRLFEDEIVIMPNHIHGIVRIMETAGAYGVMVSALNRKRLPPNRMHTANRTHGVRPYRGCRVPWDPLLQDLRRRLLRGLNMNYT